jgi:hypothetical protein
VESQGIFKGGAAVNIAGGGEPVQVPALEIDRGLLPALRVQPALGRNFTAQEDQPHGPPAMMLYHGFWLRRFGGNPAVIGQTMQVEGLAHTIVGVLPAGFDLGRASIALPTAFPAHSDDDGTNYTAVARLAPGTTGRALGAQVDARLRTFYAAQDSHTYGLDFWKHAHFGAQDFSEEEHAGQRATTQMWLACGALLLLIALVNLTALMMLRAIGRGHEASVRGALGAQRWRAALPSVAEGLLVGLVGVPMGQALAALGLWALRTWMPADWMAAEWTRPDGLNLGGTTWGWPPPWACPVGWSPHGWAGGVAVSPPRWRTCAKVAAAGSTAAAAAWAGRWSWRRWHWLRCCCARRVSSCTPCTTTPGSTWVSTRATC